MKKITGLIGILAFTVLLLLPEEGELYPMGYQRADSEVDHLIAVLRNDELRASDPTQVVKAIERLGQMRCTAAIDDLIKYMTFKRTYPWEKVPGTEMVNEIHPITPLGRYPALGALFSIGKASLPSLVKVIEENESQTLSSENAVITVVMIFREDFSQAVEYLTRMAADKTDPLSKERLLSAAQSAKRYVKQD